MDRKLTISIGVAAGTGVALLLARQRVSVAIKRWSRSRVESDDVTIARKVETHIFRPHDAPKGDVSVDVEAGVVYLGASRTPRGAPASPRARARCRASRASRTCCTRPARRRRPLPRAA